jgi:hypothetical protein
MSEANSYFTKVYDVPTIKNVSKKVKYNNQELGLDSDD